MTAPYHGRCLCGACRFELAVEPTLVELCACTSCRRASGSSWAAWLDAPVEAVTWEGEAPRAFESSPGRRWLRCPICGSLMGWRSDAKPWQATLSLAAIEDPGALAPTQAANWDDRAPWAPDLALPGAAG